MEQLKFEGMPQRLYPCTPSRLHAWLDCPRRYRFTYLDRPAPQKGPPWAHNSLGASVHNALAAWWRLPREERTVSAAGELLERGWITEGYADQVQSAAYLAHARKMVEDYVARLDPDAEPAGVERTVAMKTRRIALSGRIDRLDDRPGPPSPLADAPGDPSGPASIPQGDARGPALNPPGDARGPALNPPSDPYGRELVVVDYKTGRHSPSGDDVRSSLALALYAVAAGWVLRRPCHKVELHHLPTGQVVSWEHTPESLERQVRRAEDIAAECATADEAFRAASEREGASGAEARRPDEVFPTNPGGWCGWCDYRGHCPDGQRAAAQRRPWDGLADTVSDPREPPVS
jgi:RecB family exonuclease